MPRQRYTTEKIINKLRQAEVLLSQGRSIREVAKELAISDHTYYRWRREYGGIRTDQVKRLKMLEKENDRLKKLVANLSLDNSILKGCSGGKLVSPARRRAAVERAMEGHRVSERRACRVPGKPRSTQRYRVKQLPDEEPLTVRVCELASEYGRYGYRRVTALLRSEGWAVNHKRVERIWRQEGLKVPQKQQKRRRLWLNDTASIRLRPVRKNHVWSYDFVHDRTHDGRPYRILVIIDEFTRECLTLTAARKQGSDAVIHTLTDLFCNRGKPEYIRSDNGAEFTAKVIRSWLEKLEVAPLYIEPGSPWENGYVESFNGKMRDELLNREQIGTLREAKILLEQWRQHYNTRRPHSSLGYRSPAPEAKMPAIVPLALAKAR